MKKYMLNSAVMLMAAIAMSACKKNNGSASDSYGAAISEKTWWGTLTVPGQNPENYSVHYNADSSFLWSEQAGDYVGHWSLTDNHLTITFTNIDAVVYGDISNGNTLTNLFTSNKFTVNNSQLIASPYNKAMTGTVWKGKFTNYDGVVSDIEMDFVDEGHMNVIANGGKLYYLYTMSTSGVVFRTKPAMEDFNLYFGVITTGHEMVGTDADATRSFLVALQ